MLHLLRLRGRAICVYLLLLIPRRSLWVANSKLGWKPPSSSLVTVRHARFECSRRLWIKADRNIYK